MVNARMRSGQGWGDARILNVSSRGMMIRTILPTRPGTTIELRRGDQVMVAKVVWKDGTRAGLRSDSVLPVTDLMCVSEKAGEPEAMWSPGAVSKRRTVRIDEAASANRARAMEFAAALAVGAMVAFGLGSAALATLGQPLQQMKSAMGG